jgi:3-oxoacyl-[acyl-carrier-protein] synthase II
VSAPLGERRRVVVTGMGAITPLGCDVETFWAAAIAGRSGIGPIDAFDASSFPCRIAGQAWGFEPLSLFSLKVVNRFERFALMAMAATDQALAHSGLRMADADATRVGIFLGTGSGGTSMIKHQVATLLGKGWAYCDPLNLLRVLPDMATASIGAGLGATGPVATICASCASGAVAVGQAVDTIRAGRADVIIAGGAEAWINDLGISSFALLRALSSHNDDPQGASRPFDAQRDGFVPAEGAAMFVLEAEEHARARGATPIAEIAGFASTSDAGSLVSPRADGASAARAITLALADAGLTPGDVHYISAHGTSTPLNDAVETVAIKQALGAYAYEVPISALKSMTGHSLGAGAAMEMMACIKTIETGFVHPTINLEHPDPQCDLDYVSEGARAVRVDVALNLSYAFGGQNACLVLQRPRA